MEFLPLGGADEIGASSYLYRRAGGSLLVDAGVRTGVLGAAGLPLFEAIDHPPDAFVLTHAHLDHLGALPLLLKRYPKMRCLTSPLTLKLAAANLADTVKVNLQNGMALFNMHDVVVALNRFETVPSLLPITLDTHKGEQWRLRLTPAGHLPGAQGLLIEAEGDLVFHTGDFNNVATHLTDAAWRFTEPPQGISVISEATYGDTMLPSRKEQVQRFVTAIRETLLGGGNVLIPSFALGRAQEIVHTLVTQMNTGLLPRAPIFLDGLVRTVTEIMQDSIELLPKAIQNYAKQAPTLFFSDPVQLVGDNQQREAILGYRGVIVIASSGMLSGGASVVYARAWLGEAQNGLFLVGYQDEDSPGRRLLELQQGGEVVLPSGPVAAYCRIERYALSGHADRGGLLSHIAQFKPSLVALVHGEVPARHSLAQALQKNSPCRLPKNGEAIQLRAPAKIHATGAAGGLGPASAEANNTTSSSTAKVLKHHQAVLQGLKLEISDDGFLLRWPTPQTPREEAVLGKLQYWLQAGRYKIVASRFDQGSKLKLQLTSMAGGGHQDDSEAEEGTDGDGDSEIDGDTGSDDT
jgi:uncharacterized protein